MSLVSLERATEHLRLDSPEDEADHVQMLIDVAESHVSQYLQRTLIPWGAVGGDEPTPPEVTYAVLLHLTDLYENRSAQVEKTLSANPTVDRLLHFHRLGLGI